MHSHTLPKQSLSIVTKNKGISFWRHTTTSKILTGHIRVAVPSANSPRQGAWLVFLKIRVPVRERSEMERIDSYL